MPFFGNHSEKHHAVGVVAMPLLETLELWLECFGTAGAQQRLGVGKSQFKRIRMAFEIVLQAIHRLFGIRPKFCVDPLHDYVRAVGCQIHGLGGVLRRLGRHASARSQLRKHQLGAYIILQEFGSFDKGAVELILFRSNLLHAAEFVQSACRIAGSRNEFADQCTRFVVLAFAEQFFGFSKTYLAIVGIKLRPDFEGLLGGLGIGGLFSDIERTAGGRSTTPFLRGCQK